MHVLPCAHVLPCDTHAQAIDMKDCDVYSYKSDLETDPFGENSCVGLNIVIVVTCDALL